MGDYRPKDEFMQLAIQKAREARDSGDYAIGAVVVLDGVVLAASGNRVKIDHDPTQHAEIAAIRLACAARQERHIQGAILYTTAEPCPCALLPQFGPALVELFPEVQYLTWRSFGINLEAQTGLGEP
jgi:pyrimidine deaminase RibD-like protein